MTTGLISTSTSSGLLSSRSLRQLPTHSPFPSPHRLYLPATCAVPCSGCVSTGIKGNFFFCAPYGDGPHPVLLLLEYAPQRMLRQRSVHNGESVATMLINPIQTHWWSPVSKIWKGGDCSFKLHSVAENIYMSLMIHNGC